MERLGICNISGTTHLKLAQWLLMPRQLDLATLLKRACVCNARVCFQQFQECSEQIRDVRRRLKELSPEERAQTISELLHCGISESGAKAFVSDFRSEALESSDASKEDADLFFVSDDECHHDVEGELFLASDAEDDQQPTPSASSRSSKPRSSEPFLFLGKRVCAKALCRLIGVGSSTLKSIRSGDKPFQGREPKAKHPVFGFTLDGETAEKSHSVVMYLWHVYHHAAEILPVPFSMPNKGTTLQESDFASPEETNSDVSYRHVNEFLRTLHVHSCGPENVMIGPGTFAGPVRAVQHTDRTELFWEYVAFCQAHGMEPASISTFFRVANKICQPGKQGNFLRFRKAGDHAQCNVCTELKDRIRQLRGRAAAEGAYRAYCSHLLSQWQDRQVYWAFRSMSHQWCYHGERLQQTALMSSCICVFADGMDQAKFRCPRIRDRASKLYERLFRPQLHVTLAWLHGSHLQFSVADEDMPKNSETQQELLTRCLCELFRQHEKLPLGLNVQQDNTYREGKNRYVVSYMLLLVALRVFRWTVLSFLRPGHSHEDGDQIFSQEARLISRHVFDTPNDLVEIMDDHCRPANHGEALRKRQKLLKTSVRASAYKLDEVANWKAWGLVSGVHVQGLRCPVLCFEYCVIW